MKCKLCFSLIACLLAFQAAFCQQHPILVSLAAAGKINTRLPLADTMPPAGRQVWAQLKKEFGLKSTDVAQLKKQCRKATGVHLEKSPIQDMKLIQAGPYIKGMLTADSVSLSYVQQNKPFYMLTVPLVFGNGTLAIAYVDLVGAGGYTYLLRLEQGQWIIIKETVRWVV